MGVIDAAIYTSLWCAGLYEWSWLNTVYISTFSDLSFKKGDIVYLQRQIDENWYHGECNNQHGFFPATYVQVTSVISMLIFFSHMFKVYFKNLKWDFLEKKVNQKTCVCKELRALI